jgi:hypothetical protein
MKIVRPGIEAPEEWWEGPREKRSLPRTEVRDERADGMVARKEVGASAGDRKRGRCSRGSGAPVAELTGEGTVERGGECLLLT